MSRCEVRLALYPYKADVHALELVMFLSEGRYRRAISLFKNAQIPINHLSLRLKWIRGEYFSFNPKNKYSPSPLEEN